MLSTSLIESDDFASQPKKVFEWFEPVFFPWNKLMLSHILFVQERVAFLKSDGSLLLS